MIPGQNRPLPGTQVDVGIDGAPRAVLHERFLMALAAVDAGGKATALVPGGAPLVTITDADSHVPPLMTLSGSGRLSFELERLAPEAQRLQVVLYAPAGANGGMLLGLDSLTCTVEADGETITFAPEVRSRGESALILVEFYRHKGAFKIRAVGQGFEFGLHAYARSIGHPEPDRFMPAGGGPAPGPAPRPRPGPGRPPGPGPAPGPGSGGFDASGSGFGVHADGWIVSNAHVVDRAGSIEVVSGAGLRLAAHPALVDEANDLALLKVDSRIAALPFREGTAVHLGETVSVVGFPLAGVLGSGPQVTTGSLSAVSGPGDDCRVLQLSAPVQGGNSGGPVLDRAGLVIGVVVASLGGTGDRVPQNVNFGIKGALARLFLESAAIDPSTAAAGPARDVQDVVRGLRDAVWRVEIRL